MHEYTPSWLYDPKKAMFEADEKRFDQKIENQVQAHQCWKKLIERKS